MRDKKDMRILKTRDRLFNRYEIQNWIEFDGVKYVNEPFLEGGLGIVYRAYDLVIGDPVVLKTYKGPVSHTSRQAILFKKEANTWVQLKQHPNIVKAYDVFEYDGRYYISIEYVPGGNLRKRIGKLGIKEALAIAVGICWGMIHASETINMVHRDLKPENILLTYNNIPKITDFGLARIFDEERLKCPGPAGTWAYMAPEQGIDARSVDIRADIYSFGVILYELLSGELPIKGHRLPDNVRVKQRVKIEDIIKRSLCTQPQARFPDFKAVLERLKEIAEKLGVIVPKQEDPTDSDIIHDVMLDIPSIALRKQAENFYRLDNFEEAISCYTQLLQEESEDAEVIARRGFCYLEQGKEIEAEADFDSALSINPDNAEALCGKGQLCAKKNNIEQALRFYDKASMDSNALETVISEKAVVYEKAGRYLEALECYDSLLEKNYTSNFLVSKAIILEKMDHLREALELCEEALKIEPQSMRALGIKAHLHDWLEQPDEALEAFHRLLKEDPDLDRPWILNRIGIIHGRIGDCSAVLEFHREAYALAPGNIDYMFNVALNFEKMNDWADAVEIYRNYLSGDPSAAEVWYRLGKAYAEMDNFKEARLALERCLCLENHINAKILLENLL